MMDSINFMPREFDHQSIIMAAEETAIMTNTFV